MRKIIAIGGGEMGRPNNEDGGHYPVETTEIDNNILRLTGKENPTLLFIPTASYDSIEYFKLVKKHFLMIGFKSVDALYLSDESLSMSDIEYKIMNVDAVYVGGGNTLRMMTIWRKKGVDKLLSLAMNKGVVMSGLSAGSICWFSYGNSDSRKFTSGSDQLIKVKGLGFIDALHCPHYDTEANRQNDLKRMMKKSSKVAIALDDCSAIEVIDGKYRVIKSKSTAKARKIYWKNGKYLIEVIESSETYADLSMLLEK